MITILPTVHLSNPMFLRKRLCLLLVPRSNGSNVKFRMRARRIDDCGRSNSSSTENPTTQCTFLLFYNRRVDNLRKMSITRFLYSIFHTFQSLLGKSNISPTTTETEADGVVVQRLIARCESVNVTARLSHDCIDTIIYSQDLLN